ncbi:hypothetical protein WA026_017030 [Henosepilachna vigintioctopunctata]|uniref:Peroxisomal ATPase PEX1 n=1 Tax=Henosepilachna vigintioctopunctata TaxID=420089 RepID=A0AAW1TV97_9CUCU
MLEKTLTVKFLNVKNNFCVLHYKTCRESNVFVKISYGKNQEAYFTTGPSLYGDSDNMFGISSLCAKALQIKENDTVYLMEIISPRKVQSFTISPLRFDDYHVMDMLKFEIENCILNQTRVVNKDQSFIIWIGENLNIPVKVVSVEPSTPGVLDNLTELIILPQMKTMNKQRVIMSKVSSNPKDATFKHLDVDFFNTPRKLTESGKRIERKIQFYLNRKTFFKARLVPFNILKSSDISNFLYEFNVFMLQSEVSPDLRKIDTFKEPLFCSLEAANNSNAQLVFVRVFFIEESVFSNSVVLRNNIYGHEFVFRILECETGRQVIVKPIFRANNVKEIIVRTNNNKEKALNLLKEYLANICKNQEFVLNADIPITLNEDTLCILKFKPSSSKYCLISKDFLRNCKYIVQDDPSLTNLSTKKMKIKKDFVATTKLQSIYNTIVENLKINLKQNIPIGCSLLTGNIGCGKTTLIKYVSHSVVGPPFFIYSEIVDCKTLKGKSVDSLHKMFTSIFENLVHHPHSILFIDNIHILCENTCENDAQAQNTLYYDRISEMMYILFTAVASHCSIGIIATAESVDKLNKNFYSPRGMHLFHSIFHIGNLTTDDRSKILEHFFKDCSFELDFKDLSRRTEGYVFQDLFDFIQKAKFQSIKNDPENMIVKKKHCESALSQMTMLCLSDVKLHSSGDRYFEDIGGLTDIKKLLTETLLWPLKFPNLFDSAPIRLLSGILLYGAPGTGKTLLASAIAKQFSIRLISIKGPELLSKYIGASEQAVRDVFKKAQNAKPCILFFDEFDSLAPRRGHDSTGVTDRVVNQLLTQMDGVESLVGVSVVAATSRPDLLDPALLRPGRLDRLILCPLPDLKSRMDILRVLSKPLNLADDVMLQEIAKKTEGFSGADLQSLLYTAQLASAEHLMMSEEGNSGLKPITQEILRSALSKTKPSLNVSERTKYDLIYSKFQGKGDVTLVKPGSKVSLA